MSALFTKLNLKHQTEIIVLNAPASFDRELAQLPGVTVLTTLARGQTAAFAMAFATTQKDVDTLAAKLAPACVGDAVLWFAYPKQTSKRYTCEFNRDIGWASLVAAGFETVRMVAIDDDWSGLRFRRTESVKTTTRAAAKAPTSVTAAAPPKTKPAAGN